MSNIRPVLYGADYCLKTIGLRNYLLSRSVDFDYYNVEKDDQAAQRVKNYYNGRLKFPVMEVNGTWLKNPSIPDLAQALQRYDLLS